MPWTQRWLFLFISVYLGDQQDKSTHRAVWPPFLSPTVCCSSLLPVSPQHVGPLFAHGSLLQKSYTRESPDDFRYPDVHPIVLTMYSRSIQSYRGEEREFGFSKQPNPCVVAMIAFSYVVGLKAKDWLTK